MAKAHLGSISFVNQIANLADQLVEAGLGAGKLGGPGQRRVTWLAAAEKNRIQHKQVEKGRE